MFYFWIFASLRKIGLRTFFLFRRKSLRSFYSFLSLHTPNTYSEIINCFLCALNSYGSKFSRSTEKREEKHIRCLYVRNNILCFVGVGCWLPFGIRKEEKRNQREKFRSFILCNANLWYDDKKTLFYARFSTYKLSVKKSY